MERRKEVHFGTIFEPT
jgi:hypothetical protein